MICVKTLFFVYFLIKSACGRIVLPSIHMLQKLQKKQNLHKIHIYISYLIYYSLFNILFASFPITSFFFLRFYLFVDIQGGRHATLTARSAVNIAWRGPPRSANGAERR